MPAVVVALSWHPCQSGRATSTPTSSSQPPAAASASLPSSPAAPPPPPVPGTADSAPAGTEIITALAVDARGQPANGYREAPAGSISELAGCDQPSPSAVSKNIYSCYPSAAAADVCWPSPFASGGVHIGTESRRVPNAAWVRLSTPSLVRIALTWLLTVLGLMQRVV